MARSKRRQIHLESLSLFPMMPRSEQVARLFRTLTQRKLEDPREGSDYLQSCPARHGGGVFGLAIKSLRLGRRASSSREGAANFLGSCLSSLK
jgi:hypothetical protein